MSVVRYSVIFNGDGTYTSVPSPISVTPGTTITLHATAMVNDGGAIQPLDLTGWTLLGAVIDDTTKLVRLYLTGQTAFSLVDAVNGRFSATIAYQMTQLLVEGRTYDLEIKGEDATTGERRQICYLSIVVQPTSLASE